jgi:GT2 family glycosyltransferase
MSSAIVKSELRRARSQELLSKPVIPRRTSSKERSKTNQALLARSSKTGQCNPKSKIQNPKSSVSVIIPVFNQAALTAQCLKAVAARDSGEIIAVDDASTDGTPKVLASHGTRVKVVRHDANTGFAQSCNDGASAASGEFLVFLNNDTVPQPGWLEKLVGYAHDHPEAAVVGARLLYPNDTIQHAGVVVCHDGYPRHIYSGFPAGHPAVAKSRPFQIVTGACFLVRRKLFLSMGGFDTAFRNGFEDVDFCLRLGQMGLQVHYCAESVLYHFESSSPGRFKHDSHNVELYRKRWLKRVQPDDVRYYVEDNLLDLSYEGSFPFRIRLSPMLAVLHGELRDNETELELAEKARQAADLIRENTRLRRELGKSALDSPELQYQDLRQRIRDAISANIPSGATVLVVSKGDGALTDFQEHRGWHFPQTNTGAYAGYHPADSSDAIAHLEVLRSRGAEFFVFPKTSLWWLEHYAQLKSHLDRRYRLAFQEASSCCIYDLRGVSTTAPEQNAAFVVRKLTAMDS